MKKSLVIAAIAVLVIILTGCYFLPKTYLVDRAQECDCPHDFNWEPKPK